MMRLVSLNVSEPIEIQTGRGTVRTGIFKSPVDGARALRRLNLDGDGQADLQAHGGPNRAVYAYAVEAYAFWRRELGREDLEPGSFGENFTVEGLVDEEVLIGDRFVVGSAVVEVSQPRSPCFKLGLRLDDPQMPGRIVAANRPGFYLRVIEEGAVQAGDVFERVGREQGSLSVADINDLYWRDHSDVERLARAASIEALSAGWRAGFSEFARASTQAQAQARPAWDGFARSSSRGPCRRPPPCAPCTSSRRTVSRSLPISRGRRSCCAWIAYPGRRDRCCGAAPSPSRRRQTSYV